MSPKKLPMIPAAADLLSVEERPTAAPPTTPRPAGRIAIGAVGLRTSANFWEAP